MTNFQRVKEWMVKFGQETPPKPIFPAQKVIDLRESIIDEEYLVEFKDAVKARDLVEVADALGDILVVVYGTAVAYGIDIDEVFTEVMDSNDSKAGADGLPIFREDGKILKGPNYFKPDVVGLILKQQQ